MAMCFWHLSTPPCCVVHSWCLLTFPCCHLCASLFINAFSLGSSLTPWCFSSPLCCALLLLVNGSLSMHFFFLGPFSNYYFPLAFLFLGVEEDNFQLFFQLQHLKKYFLWFFFKWFFFLFIIFFSFFVVIFCFQRFFFKFFFPLLKILH
jgi:hypothetical protein